ncbi:hypothetical protein LC612_31405 [Nostoc sp. CHAB 5834]|nr:hypothetical protein [Nostoc sp. CHAB 5834]
MMFYKTYPAHSVYASLYARFFKEERLNELLALAGPLDKKTVADLCGGGGRLSLAAKAAGAQVTLVDESRLMTNGVKGVPVVNKRVSAYLLFSVKNESLDGAFCQQAVNYWLTPSTASSLAAALKQGGFFVFNTFNKKPSAAPLVKQYTLDGVSFVETNWLVDDRMVHHIQVREGEEPHFTSFQWLSPEEFREMLSPYFKVTEHVSGPSSIYVCTRNDKPAA